MTNREEDQRFIDSIFTPERQSVLSKEFRAKARRRTQIDLTRKRIEEVIEIPEARQEDLDTFIEETQDHEVDLRETAAHDKLHDL